MNPEILDEISENDVKAALNNYTKISSYYFPRKAAFYKVHNRLFVLLYEEKWFEDWSVDHYKLSTQDIFYLRCKFSI